MALLLIASSCSQGPTPGAYYSDGIYQKMEIKGDRVILTTAIIPVEQTFTYEVKGDEMYLNTGFGGMVFHIVNSYKIDGGIYGTFIHISYLKKMMDDPNFYEVNAEKLNVRSGPGTEYEVIHQLYAGDFVFVVERQDEWFKVKYDVDKTGYVASKFLKRDFGNR